MNTILGITEVYCSWSNYAKLHPMFTLQAGEESDMHEYAVSEEAMLCLKDKGQVFIHNQWTDVEAGDLTYFPKGVTHAVRN